VARQILLRKLSAAPRTRAELAADLAARDVPDDVAERALDRFTEVGLIDDAAFAEAWVRSRRSTRGLSSRALQRELRGKGVDDETVSAAVDVIDPESEAATAAALVARRLPGSRGLDRVARTRRLVGMLARKGYDGGLAMRVVRDALDAEGSEVSEDGFDGERDSLTAL
jgi:regulatory protein